MNHMPAAAYLAGVTFLGLCGVVAFLFLVPPGPAALSPGAQPTPDPATDEVIVRAAEVSADAPSDRRVDHQCRIYAAIGDDLPDGMLRQHLVDDDMSLYRLSTNGAGHEYGNVDGWSIAYFPERGDRWATILRGTPRAFSDAVYTNSVNVVNASEPYITLGHIRKRDSGCGPNVDDPHPFHRNKVGKHWVFVHNGGLSKDRMIALIHDGYYAANPPNCSGVCNPCNYAAIVDSELLFLFTMQKIEECDWDVIDGVSEAAHDLFDAGIGGGCNFFLTTGRQIWAFRKQRYDWHTLYYTYNEAEGWAAAASNPPSSAYNWNRLSNYNLAVLSGDQEPIVIGMDPTWDYVPHLRWIQEAKLLDGGGDFGDEFGYSVSVSGRTALVGAHLDDDNGPQSGSAFVFRQGLIDWIEEAQLLPDDPSPGDEFGTAVALHGDTAVVGAPNDSDGLTDSGSAYVFDRNGTAWSQGAKLRASDAGAYDYFGYSVAVDGDVAVIGAYKRDYWAGAAYVFRFDGMDWIQEARLLALDGIAGDYFGCAVAVSGDRVLVGARGDDDNGGESGSAYVFYFDGLTWQQTDKLLPDDGEAGDRFGESVALSERSGRALIGAHLDDNENGVDAGSAYMFLFSAGAWGQETKLLAKDGEAGDQFGKSTAYSNRAAVVGAPFANANGGDSGAAYAFRKFSWGWIQDAKLLPGDGEAGEQFGWSAGFSDMTAVVGARYDNDNGGDSGSASAFLVARVCIDDGDYDDSNGTPALRDDDEWIMDWYESREDYPYGPTLLTLDENDVGSNGTKKARLAESTTANAFLSQEFSRPQTYVFSAQWDIYVDTIAVTSNPDRAGWVLLGDDKHLSSPGPNSDDSERFACLAFRDGGGSRSLTMDLVARDRDDDWSTFTTIATGLDLHEWYTVKVICDLGTDSYEVYLDGEYMATVSSRQKKTSVTHISFAQLDNGAGTFYVDNVAVRALECTSDSECNPGSFCSPGVCLQGRCYTAADSCAEGEWCDEGAAACFACGDADMDGNVGLTDYAYWDDCVTGPFNGPYTEGCDAFDFDSDVDVDLEDFARFQEVFDGP